MKVVLCLLGLVALSAAAPNESISRRKAIAAEVNSFVDHMIKKWQPAEKVEEKKSTNQCSTNKDCKDLKDAGVLSDAGDPMYMCDGGVCIDAKKRSINAELRSLLAALKKRKFGKCNPNNPCPGGQVCWSSACRVPCDTDADCPYDNEPMVCNNVLKTQNNNLDVGVCQPEWWALS